MRVFNEYILVKDNEVVKVPENHTLFKEGDKVSFRNSIRLDGYHLIFASELTKKFDWRRYLKNAV